jgi:hypothetical protein
MLETMYVRCTHCGYDNSPEYRFCGMCGASLAHPPAAEAKPVAKEVPRPANGGGEKVPVHGPSFLGLSEDPKVEFHYLYEDEQPRSRVGLVVFLLIILGAAGYLAWQWRQGGFPFNRQTSSSSGGAQQSASPSEVAPAMNQNQQTHIDKPMTGVGDVLPTAPEQKTQPDSTGKATEFPAQGGQNPATPQKAGTGAAPSANESAEDSSTEKPASKTTEKAEATPPPSAAKSRGTKETSMRTRVPNREPQTAAPATSPDADLELAGERYLYGTGVPQNCPRAESSLRTAATHGNTKAQTVLGTMYATGHCVGRDLPTAYRWFARALHQDPQNSRISADLQVLWRQMTPQEKQLATASGQ